MANKKEYIATKPQTGVTISRNGKHFTVSWKFGDKDYGAGQTLKWCTNRNPKWQKVSGVSKTTKTKSFATPEGDYHPTSKGKYLDMLFIDLQGTRKKFTATKKIDGKNVQIDYIPQQTPDQVKSFAFYKPPKPSVSLALGGAVVSVIRYLCHVVSGATIWGGYAPEGTPVLQYSLTYNATYMLPELIITVIGALLISLVLDFSKPELIRKSNKNA
jgi:hypothetical protein